MREPASLPQVTKGPNRGTEDTAARAAQPMGKQEDSLNAGVLINSVLDLVRKTAKVKTSTLRLWSTWPPFIMGTTTVSN